MEIISVEDVRTLVHTFYEKVQSDELIGPIFNSRIEGRWPEHLEKMVRFWQTVLLNEHTYQGSPFAHHADLHLENEHFERWLALFYENIDVHFTGEKVIEAKWRAEKMAEMFKYKIDYYRNKPSKSII